MSTIIIACAVSFVLIIVGSMAYGWSFGGAEIWVITFVVLLIAAGVRRGMSPRK